jgi:hypothetical protein
MSRALLTVVLIAGFAAAAPAPATIQDRARAPEPPVARTAARVPLQPVTEPLAVIAAGGVPERRSVPSSSVDGQSSKDDSGWRTYGTLLATLVLMAAIALRRHRTGGP